MAQQDTQRLMKPHLRLALQRSVFVAVRQHAEFCFKLFNRRQAAFERLRQRFGELKSRNADRLMGVAQGILGDDSILVATKNEANRGLIAGLAQEVIYGGEIEIHLARVGRFE